MYEQVSRGIQLICCMAASLKFISSVSFCCGCRCSWLQFYNRHFSSSAYVVVDIKLSDPFLSMCDQSKVCCYQRISVHIVNSIYGGDFSSILWILFWSCGYGFILWIVDTILFRAERPHCVGTTLIQNALS